MFALTEFFLFFFYRRILIPFAWFFLGILSRLQPNKKWSHFYLDRKNPTFQIKNKNLMVDDKNLRPIWVHAASGEIEYARPLLRELKSKYPQIPILVTCTSRSAKDILDSLSEIDCWGPSPWDSISATQEFLKRWNPRALLIARTDLWPELLYQCQKNSVPQILFSATFNFSAESSYLQNFKISILKKLTKIFAVSTQDSANLKIRGVKNVLTGGDTRFDQVFYRLDHPKKIKTELKPFPTDFVFIAGSTWPEDESQLVSSLTDPQIRTIIAPHEVDETHLKSLELRLKNQNRSTQRYSQVKEWRSDAVLIIDQVGILAEIYTWGSMAFVGGSFKKQVHSVMEPLAAGLFTLVGPFHSNNREAIEFQSQQIAGHSLVTQVGNVTDIQDQIKKIKHIYDSTTKMMIRLEVKKKIGATENLLKYVASMIGL